MTYKIMPQGLKDIRRKSLVIAIPLILISMAVGVSISYYNTSQQPGNINVLPFLIPIVCVAAGFGLFRGLKRQEALLESYTLELNGTSITRYQINTPTINFPYESVSYVHKSSSGSFTVKSDNGKDCICIPAQIGQYQMLEEELAAISTITTKTDLLQRFSILISLVSLCLLLVVFITKDKWALTVCGLFVAAIIVWSLTSSLQSKNLDAKTKKSLWIIGVVLFAVLARIVVVWINPELLD